MSVHLVGGGWQDEPDGAAYRAFVEEASARAAASGRHVPRVAFVALREDVADGYRDRQRDAIGAAGRVELVGDVTGLDVEIDPALFDGVDGILVGGGLTPVYRTRLEPHFGSIRALVASGVPYLGFSAGAAVAAAQAIVGGWRIGGVEVAPEDAAEDLDEVTVLGGIGLVDVAVDVHAAQWGTLTRLVAATEAGLVTGGIAVDENTVLIAGEGALRTAGSGSVWSVARGEQGVIVRTLGE